MHPPILSPLFHDAFVFIRPFTAGSGRMARQRQTALLSEWYPIFQNLPIESRFPAYQDKYCEVLSS